MYVTCGVVKFHMTVLSIATSAECCVFDLKHNSEESVGEPLRIKAHLFSSHTVYCIVLYVMFISGPSYSS